MIIEMWKFILAPNMVQKSRLALTFTELQNPQ